MELAESISLWTLLGVSMTILGGFLIILFLSIIAFVWIETKERD